LAKTPHLSPRLLLPALSLFACQARTALLTPNAAHVGTEARPDAAGAAAPDVSAPAACPGDGCWPAACDEKLWLGGLPATATGEYPLAIVSTDFDGDGILDIATANAEANSVSVLLGEGNGTFRAKVDYQTGARPWAIVTGDWNHDGVPDLATANLDDGSVAVFLNRGSGRLARQQDIKVGAYPRALLAADLDNDSSLDLAVTSAQENTVSVLFGKGDGKFPVKAVFSTGEDPRAIVAGDFNRDGRTDLVVGNGGSHSLSILLGKAYVRFATRTEFKIPEILYGVFSIAVVDFNGDDKLDLGVVHNVGGRGTDDHVILLAGSGNGNFSRAAEYEDPGGEALAADINGDGRQDLAFLDGDRLSVLLTQKAGTLPVAVAYRYPISGGAAMAFGDFNRDGSLDIATANKWLSSVLVVLSNGNGAFHIPDRYGNTHHSSPVLLRDLNSDGRVDAVVIDKEGSVDVQLGSGDGTLADGTSYDLGEEASSIALGDIDGDGELDLVATTLSSSVGLLLGRKAGGFAPPSTLDVGREARCPALGDVNADGKLDLVLWHSADNLASVWLGEGDGAFTFRSNADMVHPRSRYINSVHLPCVALADTDGDDLPDLIVLDQTLGVAHGQGDGTFGPITTYDLGEETTSLSLGDMNLDATIDIVVTTRSEVRVLLGRGDGTFAKAAEHIVDPEGSFSSAALADLNGDGYLDLAADFGALHVLLGDGSGGFACTSVFAGTGTLAIADMNGDKRQDLVQASRPWNALTVLMNRRL